MIKNWFQVVLALMNLGAAAKYATTGSPRLAGIMVCYAAACAVFATMEEA